MDSRFWFWILIVAGSFIANMVKKKREADAKARQKPASDRSRNPSPAPATTAPMSFEELLAEIQGNKKPAPAKELSGQTPQQQYDFRDYDDESIAESNRQEKAAAKNKYKYQKDDQAYAVYDNAKKQAFERKSLEETMKLSDTDVKFGAFKGYEKQETRSLASAYARDLKKPAGLKRAFVLNEILQRRF